VDGEALNRIAGILGVTGEAIKAFTEDSIFNYFNTFYDNSGAGAWSSHGTFNFNPIDKLIEVFEENKKLYERLLSSEREKVELQKAIRMDKQVERLSKHLHEFSDVINSFKYDAKLIYFFNA
jgi:hypothetical protein